MRILFSKAILRHAPFKNISRDFSLLKVTVDNNIKRIVLANPKTRNALSLSMLKELKEAIIDYNPSVRCIVLSAEGKVFSAGHNLKELVGSSGKEFHTLVFNTCSELMVGISKIPIPVIAQVDGVAAAAGCQLVASCDIVVASDSSSFITPGANVGIFCSTPGIPLIRNVPRKVGADMLLTGLPITAQQALQAGLVSCVVPEKDLEEETEKRVKAILSKSSSVVALGKKFMYEQMDMTVEEAYRSGGKIMVHNINMTDGQEGIKSFIEKRKPIWTNKEE